MLLSLAPRSQRRPIPSTATPLVRNAVWLAAVSTLVMQIRGSWHAPQSASSVHQELSTYSPSEGTGSAGLSAGMLSFLGAPVKGSTRAGWIRLSQEDLSRSLDVSNVIAESSALPPAVAHTRILFCRILSAAGESSG